jgi:predicted LPLAT superfamily acyltransferase
MAEQNAWDRSEERGSLFALRFLVWCYRHFGRGLAFLLVDPIVGYFFLTDPKGRRASRDYLEQIAATPEGRASLRRPPSFWACYLHYRAFAVSIFDRLEIWFGRSEDFEIDTEGIEPMASKAREGVGAMLIGAHLGSFDALRLLAARDGITVNVVMYTRHAEKINRIFRDLSHDATVRVIDVEPGSVNATLEVRRCIARGEFVSLLGDRTPPGGGDRFRWLPFLGRRARFPEGPFQLASLLGCPTLFVLALRSGPRQYRLIAEPLVEEPGGPRSDRPRQVEDSMKQYAARLQHYCVRAPYQWFNFFDFWDGSPDE